MSNTLNVALVQMVSSSDPDRNCAAVERLVAEAMAARPDLVLLPEYFYFMGPLEKAKAFAEDEGRGPIQDRLKRLAAANKIHLLAGSLPLRADGGRFASATVLFGPDGAAVARYDKVHLFDIDVPGTGERHRESDQIRAGERVTCATTPWASIGLSICYDLRFPELYRALVDRGAEILTVPAAFTEATGRAHWHALLRARAIENQCFVLAPNQAGRHDDGKRTFGHSLVIDPWGEILAEGPATGEKVLSARLDLGKLRELRRSFPVLEHRQKAIR